MNNMMRLEQWSERARREPAPTPDVVADVLRRVRRLEPEPRPDVIPWLAVGLSAAAALVMAVLGLQAYLALSSPVGDWMRQISNWGML